MDCFLCFYFVFCCWWLLDMYQVYWRLFLTSTNLLLVCRIVCKFDAFQMIVVGPQRFSCPASSTTTTRVMDESLGSVYARADNLRLQIKAGTVDDTQVLSPIVIMKKLISRLALFSASRCTRLVRN